MTPSHDIVIAHEVAALRAHAPLAATAADVLAGVIRASRLSYFPRGSQVLDTDDGLARRELYILRAGRMLAIDSAGARRGTSDMDSIGPGGMFPVEAATGTIGGSAFQAQEDCYCWIVSGEALQRLLAEPAVLRWLLRRAVDELAELRRRYREDSQAGHIASEMLRLPLSSLMSAEVLTLGAEASVADAAQLMAKHRIGSVLIADGARPAGIVTESDLLRRVYAHGRDASAPLSSTMTPDPFVLPASATVAEAALEMTTRHIRHVPVVDDDGSLRGVLSERDLFKLQRQGVGHFGTPIERAATIDELADAVVAVRDAGRAIFEQGMSAEALTRLISSLNDRALARVLELARRPGDPAGEFCWLAFGSEGRHEQTFATDQDNGIIFAAPATQRRRYLDLAERVNAALDRCGFPFCNGGVMARNPDWCLTLDEWRDKFSAWIRSPTPEALLFATIFFDFRPLHGDVALAEALRDHLFSQSRENTIFLRMMASNALSATVPLGTFTRFSTDGGEHGGTIDLKRRGAVMFVDAARIFALAEGVRATNTAERLRVGGRRVRRGAAVTAADVSAFHIIQSLRLRAQLGLFGGARTDLNRIDPYALHELDQRILREALRQAQHLQDRLKLDYRL